jgi:squalene cyclase
MVADAKPPEPTPPMPETFVSQPAIPIRPADHKPVPEVYRHRAADNRQAQLQRFGGTPDTEAAVAAALDWLAAHQSGDGRWVAADFGSGRETKTLGQDRGGAGARADTGITALALLAFLGAGETHYEGKHRENVQHALEYLISSQASNGSLAGHAELFAQMYCHGMATLALAESWATSGDERLAEPVRRAIRYTLDCQHSGGGWRYQPLDQGDMSQFGWQLMALKSAEASGLAIPDSTRQRMIQFLRSVSSGQQRGLAAYRPNERASRTMTAEAAMCRIFLNADNSSATLDEAISFVREEPPGTGRTNYYYWYYGTIAMFQRQGPAWNEWNEAMQQRLLSLQRADGNLIGTWDPDTVWGGYGGRIYSTALATLCLEVYYRYLPLYGDAERITSQPEKLRPR